MTKKVLILGLALGLMACSATTAIPIDDAYYAPSIENPSPASPTSPASSTSTTSTTSPSIEYVNVQDTTVTIRIK